MTSRTHCIRLRNVTSQESPTLIELIDRFGGDLFDPWPNSDRCTRKAPRCSRLLFVRHPSRLCLLDALPVKMQSQHWRYGVTAMDASRHGSLGRGTLVDKDSPFPPKCLKGWVLATKTPLIYPSSLKPLRHLPWRLRMRMGRRSNHRSMNEWPFGLQIQGPRCKG